MVETTFYAKTIVKSLAQVDFSFTTDTVPVDGFWNMIMDICSQNNGESPKPIESRLHLVGTEAEKAAQEWVEKKYLDSAADWMLAGYPPEIQAEMAEIERLYYVNHGYTSEILDLIDVYDVNLGYVKNLLS